ncbi:hypothetical protein Q5P01_000448 [Channa striata]|uniref:TNFR-Cys domain-containing protein n=1 Tax=Channa striata TaxID=64152 RepID=A0AA88IL39_CHASR|nr:hypothetical protein Q5P01_000448 [Channa striata]
MFHTIDNVLFSANRNRSPLQNPFEDVFSGTASSDTLCSRCPDGTFSDGTLTLCRPHTQCESQNLQLIKAGNAAADAECGEKSLNETRIVVGAVVVFIAKKKQVQIIPVWYVCEILLRTHLCRRS